MPESISQSGSTLSYFADLKSLLTKAPETEPDWSRRDASPVFDEDLLIGSPTISSLVGSSQVGGLAHSPAHGREREGDGNSLRVDPGGKHYPNQNHAFVSRNTLPEALRGHFRVADNPTSYRAGWQELPPMMGSEFASLLF